MSNQIINIFVLEFITSGGMVNQDLHQSLTLEGAMMFESIVKDLSSLKQFNVIATRDKRIKKNTFINVYIDIDKGDEPYKIWADCFKASDYCIIVAPETDSVLLQLCELAESNNCVVMGCTGNAIKLASSKLRTIQLLDKQHIKTPATSLYAFDRTNISYPAVIKPDDGVGSEYCFCVNTDKELSVLNDIKTDDEWILQEKIEGEPASIVLFGYKDDYKILSINRQIMCLENGCFQLKKIIVNEYSDQHEKFKPIMDKLFFSMPGFTGLFGIDCIITPQDIVVMEINPRITTSYCKLFESLSMNPMKMLTDYFLHGEKTKINTKKTKSLVIDLGVSDV